MNDPVIYVLVGLPGSGKSTFVEKFASAEEGHYTILSTDNYIEARAAEEGKTYNDVFQAYIKSASADMAEHRKQAISARRSIIHDQTNLGLKKRRGILAQLPEGYHKVAVYFEIDEGLRQQRLTQRPGKVIPAHIDQGMRDAYVRPTVEEGFDEVVNGTFFMELAA